MKEIMTLKMYLHRTPPGRRSTDDDHRGLSSSRRTKRQLEDRRRIKIGEDPPTSSSFACLVGHEASYTVLLKT